MAETVIREIEGHVAHVRLNRPEAGNAVDGPMFALLLREIEALHADPDLRAVVFSGAGDDFCLGRDRQPPSGAPSALQMREGVRIIPRLNQLIATLPMPTIAAVQGRAAGMGAGLTLQCDLTVAAETATLAFPEIEHDLPPTIVLSYLPRYLAPKRCFELVLLGRPIDAATAVAWGLFNQAVPAAQLLETAMAMARGLARHSGVALRTVKQYLLQNRGLTDAQAYELGINMLANVATSGEVGLYDRR